MTTTDLVIDEGRSLRSLKFQTYKLAGKQPPQKRAKNNQLPQKRAKNALFCVHRHRRPKSPPRKVLAPPALDLQTLTCEGITNLIECATLALKDHAIQQDCSVLRFLKLEKASYNEAEKEILMITFDAFSQENRTHTLEAHVRDNEFKRQVIKFGIRSCTNFKWYTGTLCVPKI